LDSGYYSACAGLRSQTHALELVANNLANVNTAGYRGQQPTFRSMLAASSTGTRDPISRAVNHFNVTGETQLDLSNGSFQPTGNPLDLAIQGKGFFAVRVKAGMLYTRNGSFQTSASGQLTTAEGDLVMGEQGPITLPSGTLSVSADGTLSSDGAVVGKLQLVEFAPGTPLLPAGNSYYAAPAGKQPQPAANAELRQATLESSNTNAITAVVDLITVQRHAEMLQHALSAFHNEFNRIAVTDLPHV
jgi:flagellar basal-body rod protein FlgF